MTLHISQEAARRMFEEYSPYVYRTAWLLTKSEALADDITQETFIQAFRKYDAYDSNNPFKPWIYKITLNTMRNTVRKHKWLTLLGIIPDQADERSVEREVMEGEAQAELRKEIDRLPRKLREVIVLHFYAGLKLGEAAEALDIPVGTCKSRLHAALTRLRKQMPQNEYFQYRKGGKELYDRG
ncbi:RNA polymerase sigma factor [Paenibacillus allorhizosphaerae]|uniref:RNA polymerase sigma factor n=1 Tax=Paenibacillus allorhizosphaerae TaxID=2849866 RepID=A0ABM8VEP7_9BACL|nr:RNA polymerase sigma factor [Paenibacillus allorhizosphaerae]CAG7631765.1 ECF RNA polymerase sigma factor SigW [Paenibacillus allorhizosphaerae]